MGNIKAFNNFLYTKIFWFFRGIRLRVEKGEIPATGKIAIKYKVRSEFY
jgi:hypothetical protein